VRLVLRPRYAGAVERRDVAQHPGGRLDDREGEDGARALAQAQVEVEHGPQAQRGQGAAGPGLGGAVAGDQVAGGVGAERGGGQRGGAGDHPVEDDGDAQRGAA
jgi:hypothetical protein